MNTPLLYPKKIILWLEIILAERFGHPFKLFPKNIYESEYLLTFNGDRRNISIAADPATFMRSDSKLPCTSWDATSEGWHSILESSLYAPGITDLPYGVVTRTEKGMHISYDIIGLTYWMLTRQEEVGRTDLDDHGRFAATSSHAYKNGYLERPVVDEWLHILGQVIQRTWPSIKLKQNSFSIKVSHDVDQPSQYAFKTWGQIARIMGGHLIKRRDLKAFVQTPYIKLVSINKIHASDNFYTFDWIMSQSEQHGLKSAFYFMCSNSGIYDGDYILEDRRIRHLIRKIHQRGHEIGLHPSYGSYQKTEMIGNEFSRLLSICDEEKVQQSEWGGRMHYLKWTQPDTLRSLEKSGLDYDSTLGYADRPGFRCGTCFEYPAFDPVAKETLKLRVRPLILMDSTFIGEKYLGIGMSEQAENIALKLKNICRKLQGTFTILWHNSTLTTKQQIDLYLAILSK